MVEGIYALWDADIRALFDLKVYLHVDADIRFIRRLHRDVRERGRTLDGIIRQYYDSVRPMHHEFLEPTRSYADLIVGEETDIGAEVIAARVREQVLRAAQDGREAGAL
jgi:uridine kinase